MVLLLVGVKCCLYVMELLCSQLDTEDNFTFLQPTMDFKVCY